MFVLGLVVGITVREPLSHGAGDRDRPGAQNVIPPAFLMPPAIAPQELSNPKRTSVLEIKESCLVMHVMKQTY